MLLAWNKIRTKGFLAFFNSIKDNSSLVSLNLEVCSFQLFTFLAINHNVCLGVREMELVKESHL
jgi:hypothetical protein